VQPFDLWQIFARIKLDSSEDKIMKSTKLKSALFTKLDDAQSAAVNGGYSCYLPRFRYLLPEKYKSNFAVY
jgi:hypothetical protein